MTVIDLATPKLAELDDARATIERLAAANQALTQRLDREHSMRLAAEEWIAVASVCELLAAWGRAQDSEHYLGRIRWAANIHRDVKEAIELASDALYGRAP